jgi:hypothetical protein
MTACSPFSVSTPFSRSIMAYPLAEARTVSRRDEGLHPRPWMAQAEPIVLNSGVPFAYPGGLGLPASERRFLLALQQQALLYFLDNQHPCGLTLDRQHNHGPRRAHGLCSMAATGMGFIAVALASAPPYYLITPGEARSRLHVGLRACLERLPHDHGIMPHFVCSATGTVYGIDYFSTVESAWVVAGALWASAFLGDPELEQLAERLSDRIDYRYWTAPAHGAGLLLRHGKTSTGRFLDCSWDRLNGETAFLYALALGAAEERSLGAESWRTLRSFHGTVAGLHFNNADLGLFVFQYGLDLMDWSCWHEPGGVNLAAEARLATLANVRACRAAASTFVTYRRFWGLSAGDGPDEMGTGETYRAYAPAGPIDGTAHLTATLASVAHCPAEVLRNLTEAQHDHTLNARGRYGFSNVNLDRGWVARDMVGIDAGAAVLALDNYLQAGRVRKVFQGLPCISRARACLGAPCPVAAELRKAS